MSFKFLKRIRILDNYSLKQFALLFLGVLFCLTAIIMLFDMVELLRTASKRENITFFNVLTLTLLKYLQFSLPRMENYF